jgi:hypothetical protein
VFGRCPELTLQLVREQAAPVRVTSWTFAFLNLPALGHTAGNCGDTGVALQASRRRFLLVAAAAS